jgi:oxygen-independent coproporphyrinogen III oxidase
MIFLILFIQIVVCYSTFVNQETSIYLHIPFCRRRCGYCDFNTFAGFSHAIPAYVKALCREVEIVSGRKKIEDQIQTIFFGGGTPSLLNIQQFSEILDTLRKSFKIDPTAEITLEANPGTVSREYLSGLRQMGFNRISFGMQSAHPHELAMLDRSHTFTDVTNAVAWSRMAGFEHINLDLIFAIPGQTLEHWQQTLKLAAGFNVDHLSLYSLTIEEGTPMARWDSRGILEVVEDDLNAVMYQSAGEILQSYGFIQYEISNWAKTRPDGVDSRCRHNLNTWRYQPYFGFGAGAHGFIGNTRTANVEPIPAYLERMNLPQGDWPAAESLEQLTPWDEMQEFMMVGLRLTDEGISQIGFQQRFGVPCSSAFGRQIKKCIQNGLLEFCGNENDRIRLTPRGKLLGNQVFLEFVGNNLPVV